MRILVTGGAGFIGSNLVPLLLSKGHSVVVLDNLQSGKLENLDACAKDAKFKFVRADIRDKSALGDATACVDSVVHLAALIDVAASVTDPASTNDVNVTGTLNVLQAAAEAGVRRFVFASSTAVYGDTETLPVKEDTVLKPLSPYAASKAAGEAYCCAYSRRGGLEAVRLRFFNVYGPRNENSPYSGVISKFLRCTIDGKALTIFGDGLQTRDFIHVSDVASALVLALERKSIGGDVFNVCTGTPTSIDALAEMLGEVTGRRLQVKHADARAGDIKFSYGDPSKAAKGLGFKAKVGMASGLKLLLEQTTR